MFAIQTGLLVCKLLNNNNLQTDKLKNQRAETFMDLLNTGLSESLGPWVHAMSDILYTFAPDYKYKNVIGITYHHVDYGQTMFHPLRMYDCGRADNDAHRSETAFKHNRYAAAHAAAEGKSDKTGMGKRSYRLPDSQSGLLLRAARRCADAALRPD